MEQHTRKLCNEEDNIYPNAMEVKFGRGKCIQTELFVDDVNLLKLERLFFLILLMIFLQ